MKVGCDSCKGEGAFMWVYCEELSARPYRATDKLVVISFGEAGLDPLEREVNVGFVQMKKVGSQGTGCVGDGGKKSKLEQKGEVCTRKKG